MRERLARGALDQVWWSRPTVWPGCGMLVWGLVVALMLLSVYTSQAGAATGHRFVASLTGAPSGIGLLGPAAVAVERSSGRVFVGDRLSGVVVVYNSSGEFVTEFGGGSLVPAGIAVDDSSGDVYVADPFHEVVQVYRPDGEGGYGLLSRWLGAHVPGKEFGEVASVAVDNSEGPSQGDLYVVEARTLGGGAGAVDVVRPKPNPKQGEAGEEGEFLGRLSSGKLGRPDGIAVSQGSGRILVADSVKGAVWAYSPTGEYEEKLNGNSSPNGPFNPKGEEPGNVAAIAVDAGSGDIYVAEGERHVVSQYSAKGVWEGWITETLEGELGAPSGVGLNSGGDVYLADSGLAVVDRFGPGVVVPDVETGKVAKTTLTRTTAVLSGTVNGDGIAAQYSFQYGETPSLGFQTQSKPSGTGLASVSAEVTGLAPGTTYYYRIVGSNENGANVGVVRSFETLPAVGGLATGPVKELQPDQAILTGTLNPSGLDTHYYFQWGTTDAYGSTTPAPPGTDAGAGTSAIEAETRLTGLSANTVYHYRMVGDNEPYGATYGQDRTFTTSGPPRIAYGPEPVNGITQTQATIHAQITPDQLETTYRFQYGETSSYGAETPAGGEAIGSGSTPVARTAILTNLKVGTTYHYRVLAENDAGITEGPDQTFTTVPAAPVDATYATIVSATEATLHAQINPLGNDTRYYFEYGTQSCEPSPNACTSAPPPPGEDIGEGHGDVAREVKLSGLQPDTTYHFRVLASNTLGDTQGAEHTFTTQQEATFALPDHRAWEMVTPPDKEGAPVEALTREGGIILAGEKGNALTYVVDGALGEEVEGNRSPEMQQVLATRGQSAWGSRDIATPSSTAKGITAGPAPEYQFFSPDLALALDEPAGFAEPPLASGVTQATPYLRDNTTGTFLPLVTEANTAPGTHFNAQTSFASATSDLSHIVLISSVALTGAGSAPGLYEWAANQLQLVSVLPSLKPASGLVELGFFGRVLTHSISNDGSRVIWTTKEENSGRGHLYMRDTKRGETIQLDAAKGTPEPEKGSAQFQGASSDGSRVFFTDRQRLTVDATTEVGQAQTAGKPDLYECEIEEVAGKLSCYLKDLTVDHNEGEHATVQNFIFGASEDGASIYLIAQGVLASNENGNGERANAGRNNLYELNSQGSQWTTTFIATLSEADSPEWEGNRIADTAFLTARVSPSGRYLAFMSAAPITGYDNVDANPAANGARDEEVYLYDSATTSLRCVSCNPSGSRPGGVLDTNEAGEGLGLLVDRRRVWLNRWLAGNIPGWTAQSITSALIQSRYLSDEGRLYFNSPDSLVAAAKNHKENVYQYEPSGVGSCQSPSGGCIALISGGNSQRESAFIEATPNGGSVFFVTESQLLPQQDTDTAFDIYDARECSGASPCLTPPASTPPGCADTDTCRPAAPAQPIPGGPSDTATFSGSGNVVSQPRAAKQQVQARKTTKRLTRNQKRIKALKRCRRHYKHHKREREHCERHSRARYRTKHKRTATQSKEAIKGATAGEGGGRR
jgi:hypothetical protein